jgi:hypothetical protein
VKDLIQRVTGGDCGPLSLDAVRDEYKAEVTDEDESDAVRRAIVLEGLTHCMEHGDEGRRRWILRHAVEVKAIIMRMHRST